MSLTTSTQQTPKKVSRKKGDPGAPGFIGGKCEQFYPLPNDSGLQAAGVEVGARVTLRPGDAPQLRIIFRRGKVTAEVTCVHVVLCKVRLADLPPDDAIA